MATPNSPSEGSSQSRERIWVSVMFDCCRTYQRVYFPKGKTRASGSCPRCLRRINFQLSEEGNLGRFFIAEE